VPDASFQEAGLAPAIFVSLTFWFLNAALLSDEFLSLDNDEGHNKMC